jgi:nucleotide-binding universal stress UspA family protein
MEKEQLRILIAFDGSELALQAVRYVAAMFQTDRTEVVLFHVETQTPESFWEPSMDLSYQNKTPDIRAFLVHQKKTFNLTLKKAYQILLDVGFPKDAIVTKIQEKKIGIARDIIRESQDGYDALLVGRKGTSKVKDILLGSITTKLLGKIYGVPLIVVGNASKQNKILVAFDESKEIMRAVRHLGKVVNSGNCKINICHIVRSQSIFQRGDEVVWQRMEKERMAPKLNDVKTCLFNMGIPLHNVTCEILTDKISRASGILERANEGKYGTLVIGRRGLTIVKEFFVGRVGQKIFQLAGDMTVWVIS